MQLKKLDPELRRKAALLPPMPVQWDWGRRAMRALIRRAPQGEPVEDVAITKLEQGQGLRLYTPVGGGSGAALLWIHGGGFVIGDLSQDDSFCAATAHELGILVVSVEYRLAPEHPFPAALNDVFAAWQWLQESAGSLGVDPGRIAVGGQSAGGGLAACLVQRLHDDGGTQPVAQWLLSPMLDDRTAARRELDPLRHRVWSNTRNRTGWRAYLDAAPGGPHTPDYAVAARRTDVHGLPPAWIGVGDVDLFADEDSIYAQRLRDAGIDCTFDLVPRAPHGFEAWASTTRVARGYLERSRAWLGARLTGPTQPIPGRKSDTETLSSEPLLPAPRE